jgi:hypothetical protein
MFIQSSEVTSIIVISMQLKHKENCGFSLAIDCGVTVDEELEAIKPIVFRSRCSGIHGKPLAKWLGYNSHFPRLGHLAYAAQMRLESGKRILNAPRFPSSKVAQTLPGCESLPVAESGFTVPRSASGAFEQNEHAV